MGLDYVFALVSGPVRIQNAGGFLNAQVDGPSGALKGKLFSCNCRAWSRGQENGVSPTIQPFEDASVIKNLKSFNIGAIVQYERSAAA
ncbi:hypothetical protein [Shimia sp. MIT1388]|uniref:hypothetical protein n=1 Tax=Shimia sp. MIT1388 TaxID=3096992 RepID=UPI003999F619